MTRIPLTIFAIAMIGLSCKSSEIKQVYGKDTTQIIETVFNSSRFKKYSYGRDSIYVTISKAVNDSWPSKKLDFKIFYIKSEKNVSIIDFSPTTFYDKRYRVTVPFFKIDKNIATISLVIYYNKEHYNYVYKLRFLNNKWKLL